MRKGSSAGALSAMKVVTVISSGAFTRSANGPATALGHESDDRLCKDLLRSRRTPLFKPLCASLAVLHISTERIPPPNRYDYVMILNTRCTP